MEKDTKKSVLEKEYGFYAFMSTESEMIGNPIRYEIAEGLVPDLIEKVSYDVGKIIDALKSKLPFGQKWSHVVMLDTLKKSVVVQYNRRSLKFFVLGDLSSILPVEFFSEVEDYAKVIREEKKRYDDIASSRAFANRPPLNNSSDDLSDSDEKETRIHFLRNKEGNK